ncbi:MAG: tetratricopeptide repeat protein [Acidobacteriota bacterium]|jgi:tetratricopeptide (TPR) repeat protein
MEMNRKLWNIIFAVISIGLLVVAALAVIKTEKPIMHSSAQNAPTKTAIPEPQPPLENSQVPAELIRKSAENPEDAGIQAQIGNQYYDQENYAKAADFYQKSLDLSPQNPPVETDLATCLYNLGRYDEALEHLDHVLEYAPGFSQALYNKGIVLIHGKGDVDGGIQVWEQLLLTDMEPARREELQRNIQQLKSSAR